ncbi:MAG: tetratricopeptide repeat protein [Candidatus Altiarchaeota archaeon]
MRKTTIIALTLILAQTMVSAESLKMNLETRWAYNTNVDVGAIAVADGTGNGRKDVVIGLSNDTVVVLDRFGVKKYEYAIGNASQIGSIYAMDAADVDGDGKEEVIFGLGGAREVRVYEAHAYEVDPKSMTIESKDKVLYRLIKNHGSVYVMKTDGSLLWRYLTDDSVRAVAYVPNAGGKAYVTAGVGDVTIYEYNQRSSEPIPGRSCITTTITDENAQWATSSDCYSKACEDLNECTAEWDLSCLDTRCKKMGSNCYRNTSDIKTLCSSGTQDVCLISYDKIVCGENLVDKEGWRISTEKTMNGSVVFLDRSGKYVTKYDVVLRLDDGMEVPGADNAVRKVKAADLTGDREDELIVGSNNGQIMALNITNISAIRYLWKAAGEYIKTNGTGIATWEHGVGIVSLGAADLNNDKEPEITSGNSKGLLATYDSKGKLQWKQRISDAITGIDAQDIQIDQQKDLIVSSRDRTLYVYDSLGNIQWTYMTNAPLYGVLATDIDENDLADFIIRTTRNVTRLETNDYYIKKYRADAYFNTANENYLAGDYTTASIYVDKATEVYKDIGAQDDLALSSALRKKIDEEFKGSRIKEGDRLYNLAVKYYSMNDFQTVIKNLEQARNLYQSIGYEEGVKKCDKMAETMREELKRVREYDAESRLSMAETLLSFGNYTGAVELIYQAKQIYQEIGEYNETARCDMLVLKVADTQYTGAQTAYERGDYPKAIEYALAAKELYDRVGAYNMSIFAQELMQKANSSAYDDGSRRGETDYTPYLLGAIFLAIIVILYMRSGGQKIREEKPVREDRNAGTDDELEGLEGADR